MINFDVMFNYISSIDAVTIDIESTGLHKKLSWKHTARDFDITMLGIGDDVKQFIIPIKLLTKRLLKSLKVALKGKRVIYHNGNYDILQIWEKLGVRLPITDDTQLLAYTLDESLKMENLKLKLLVQQYLGIPNWDIELKGKLKDSKQTRKYCKLDVKYTHMLFLYLWKKLDKKLRRVYLKQTIPAYKTYISINKRGIMIDIEMANKNILVVDKQMKKLKYNLDTKYGECNLNSSPQLAELLFGKLKMKSAMKTPKGAPSTSKEALNSLIGLHPIIEDILEYKRIEMLYRFLFKSIDEHIGGRLYPTYNLFTTTGRTSCSKPNLQQIPRDALVRNIFTAPKGYDLLEVDYSQIELRICADIANEQTMIAIYKNNGDIHKETGQTITKKKVLTKKDRDKSKAVNFGFIYGMLAKGFMSYAKNSFGVPMTINEATAYRQRFFAKYNDLLMWHKKEKQTATVRGFCENKIGRRRNLPNIRGNNFWLRGSDERKALNTPVQSFASDILINAMTDINTSKKLKPYIKVVGSVHDSILIEVKRGTSRDKVMALIVKKMEHPKIFKTFNCSLKVPLLVDAEIGNWGAGKLWSPSTS